jgi:MYXO-CTERM domain-containing protein
MGSEGGHGLLPPRPPTTGGGCSVGTRASSATLAGFVLVGLALLLRRR